MVCCPSAPLQLNLRKTITSEKCTWQINAMHWKLQCLQLALVSRMGSILHNNAWPCVVQAVLQKLNKLGCGVLPHPPYSPVLSPTDYHFFKRLNDFFCREKCFHNQQEAENALQKSIESWSTDFYATGINKFVFHWQKCIDCSGSYFD